MGDKDLTIEFGPIKLMVDPNDSGGLAYRNREWFEQSVSTFYDDVQRILNPSWYFDIGANYGLTSIFARTRFPNARLVVAEPNPTLADFIRANFARNGVENYELFEGFVGDRAARDVAFHVLPKGTQDCRVISPGPAWHEVRVAQTTLDLLTDRVGANDSVVIKVDTQGYEDRVFRGGSMFFQRNRRWIVKSEFAPHWLRSQGTEPLELLSYLVQNYAVVEASSRQRFGQARLRDEIALCLSDKDLPAFVEHVENLNRDRRGWVDLLVMPHSLRDQMLRQGMQDVGQGAGVRQTR